MNAGTSSIAPGSFPVTINGGTASFYFPLSRYNNSITIGGTGAAMIGSGAPFTQTLLLDDFSAHGSLSLSNGISGTGDLSLGDSGNISITGNITATGAIHFSGGNITINTANTFNANITLDAATSTFNANAVFNSPVTVTAGYHTFNSNAKFFGLSIIGGTVDTTTAKLIIETTPTNKPATLAAPPPQNIAIHSLTSSALSANFGIALINNAIPHFTLFGGTSADADSLLLSQELLGDANIDGTVDLSDLSTILTNFGATSPNWTDGNFDAPTIDLTDLSDVLNNFGLTNPNPSGLQNTDYRLPTPAPEPATLPLLAAAFLFRRSRNIRNREHICART